MAWLRYDIASSLARDAHITLWSALTNAKAVASSDNVEVAVVALQRLTDAILTCFVGIMCFVRAFMFLVPVLRRRRPSQVPPFQL